MKKPELLVTAGNMDEFQRFINAGADAVNIGEQQYGMRLPGEFFVEDIKEAVAFAHNHGVKVYVSVNNIMHNDMLPELPNYLLRLQEIGVDAVVFGDPAVLVAMKQANVKLPLHWSTEMTSTNYGTANYWASKGATRVFVARELNLEEVQDFKDHVQMEVQVQVHGITNIYHSKRSLVKSYMEHQGKEVEHEEVGLDRHLHLVEFERQDEKYPVYEDRNGTHIMSSDDICMLEDLHELMKVGIDSFKIEGLMKSVAYNEAVIRSYRQVIDAYMADPQQYQFQEEWLDTIKQLQDPERELSFGFFYKEQVY